MVRQVIQIVANMAAPIKRRFYDSSLFGSLGPHHELDHPHHGLPMTACQAEMRALMSVVNEFETSIDARLTTLFDEFHTQQ